MQKINQKQTWETFFDFVKGRNIALFGNAKSLFVSKRQVDNKYDIIGRMNSGFPKHHEKYLGERTDILFLSIPIQNYRIKELNPKFIIWCTPKTEAMTKWLKNNALIYKKSDWNKLYKKIGYRPSTGAMAIDIFLKTKYKSLTLYGFDNWKTATWYTNKIHLAKHNPKAEQKYIKKLINKGKIKIDE